MENVKVVAEYGIAMGGFDAQIKDIEDGWASVEKASTSATNAATKGTQNLSAATGSLTDKVAALVVEEQKAAEASKELASTSQKSVSIFGRLGEGIKQFGLGARDGFRTAIKEVGGFRGILSQTGGNIANFGKGAINTFKGVGSFAGKALQTAGEGVISAAKGIPVLGTLAAALGPVGIAAAGVATGLFKVITNTDAGATALQGLGKTGGLVFDRITGAVTGFFDELVNGTGIIGGVFDFLSGAVDVFINKLTPIGDIFRALSETSLFKGLKEDFEDGQRIAQIYDDLDQKQRNSIGTVASLDAEYQKLNVQLRDRTKTEAERLAIADQLTAVERERAKIALDLAKENTKAIEEEVAAARKRNEVSDDLDRRLQEARAAEIRLSGESVERLEKAENRKNAITEKSEQDRAAARQKAAAAREKAEQEQARKLEQRAQAEAKINETIAGLQQEVSDRTLTEAELEVETVKRKYAEIEKATLEGIAKIRAAAPANEQSAITKQEADAVIAIELAKADELAAINRTASEAANEQLRTALQTEEEIRIEAALKTLDEQLALADQFVTNKEERDAVVLELTKKTEEEITAITNEGIEARLKKEEEAAERLKALEEGKQAIRAAEVQAVIGTASALGDFISAAAGKNEEAAKVALGIQKAVAIANIIVQTQAATAAALAQSVLTLGPIAGPPAAVPTISLLQATAGLSIATILAQVITGAYTGEERVGVNEAPQLPGTKDRYLRRVHKNEGIVDAETNMAHLDAINAMRRGEFDDWVLANYLPQFEAINDDDRMVRYMDSDVGQRMAQSITLPRMFDKQIVMAMNGTRREQQETNELLSALVHQTKPRRSNPRYN